MSQLEYLTQLEPLGSVLAPELFITVYDVDSNIYQVFLTGTLSILNGSIIDSGGLSVGSFSPVSAITMDEHTRKIGNIPEDAAYMAWAYPLSGLNILEDSIKRKLDPATPEISFILFGGFLFFNENNELLQANAIYSGNNISFDKPKEINYGYVHSTLVKAGRLQDVTRQELIDIGVTHYCWINPNEKIGTLEIAPFGGFMYVYTDKKVQYFEIIKASEDQQFDPFLDGKTPFSSIQNCLKYIETEFDEKMEGLNDKEIIIRITEKCKEFKAKVDELQDVFSCKQCMVNPQNVAFNCGHMLCHECARTVDTCPMCRVEITSRLDLFYS